jgi:hypothetical protein
LNQSDEFFIGGEAPEIEAEETHAYIRKWLKENVSEKAVARGFSSQVNLEGNSMDRLESVFLKLNWLMFIDMFFFYFYLFSWSRNIARSRKKIWCPKFRALGSERSHREQQFHGFSFSK